MSPTGADAVARIPQLTQLLAAETLAPSGSTVHEQVLAAVSAGLHHHAAAVSPLQVLGIGPVSNRTDLQLTCDCLERCRRLRSVSVSVATLSHDAVKTVLRHLFALPEKEELHLECVTARPLWPGRRSPRVHASGISRCGISYVHKGSTP